LEPYNDYNHLPLKILKTKITVSTGQTPEIAHAIEIKQKVRVLKI